MKDWKTWAIVVLAAWCALLTYHPVKSYTEKMEQKRRHEEWELTKGAEIRRENERLIADMKKHGRACEKIKMERHEVYTALTNSLYRSDPERFKRVFKDAE